MFAFDFLKILFKTFLLGRTVHKVFILFPLVIWLVISQSHTDHSASPVFILKFSIFISQAAPFWVSGLL